jgi:hypothetical protein
MKDGPTMAAPGTQTTKQRISIKEGFYFHENQRSKIPFLRPKSHVERYLVLRKSDKGEICNRGEESLDVIEIYDSEQDWNNFKCFKPMKSRGPWYRDQILLEDLYYIHTHDIDLLKQRKDNSLYFQCVLYFRAQTGNRLRKLEMWFKRDDKEKRTQWVTEIDNTRSEIHQLKLKDKLPNKTSPAEYYKKNDLYPEVEYVGFNLENSQNIKPQGPNDVSYDDAIRKKTNLTEKEHYHLTFKEKPPRTHNEKFEYCIVFIDLLSGTEKHSINSNDYMEDGEVVSKGAKTKLILEYRFRLRLAKTGPDKIIYALNIKFSSEEEKTKFKRELQ